MRVAQRGNWTDTFASFTDESETTRVGVQVVAIDSDIDRRLAQQHRLMTNPQFRRRYDDIKRQAAHLGADGYWQAKNDFWQAQWGAPDV